MNNSGDNHFFLLFFISHKDHKDHQRKNIVKEEKIHVIKTEL